MYRFMVYLSTIPVFGVQVETSLPEYDRQQKLLLRLPRRLCALKHDTAWSQMQKLRIPTKTMGE